VNIGNLLPFCGKSADQVVEQLIGAVGHNHPRRVNPVKLCRDLACLLAAGIRIFTQCTTIIPQLLPDRCNHLWRWRIRILIGVQLDPARTVRLKSGDVAGHLGDIFT